MEKKTYYVTVAAGEIADDKTAFDFEFEIEATEEQIDQLQALFDDTAESEQSTASRAATPFKEYHDDEANDWYDENLRDIYEMLHRLGTPETKAHLEKIGVLGKQREHELAERYPLG